MNGKKTATRLHTVTRNIFKFWGIYLDNVWVDRTPRKPTRWVHYTPYLIECTTHLCVLYCEMNV